MARLLPVVLRSLLSGESLSEDETAAAVTALQVIDQFARRPEYGSEDEESFDALTNRHPEVRRQLVWRQVEVYQERHGNEPRTLFLTLLTGSTPLLKPAPADMEWLLRDLEPSSDPQRRLLALAFVAEIWTIERRPRRIRERIRKAIGSDPVLNVRFKELNRGGRWLPIRLFWHHKIANRFGNAWWWRRHADRFRAKWQHIREQWFLLRNLGKLASGTRTNWLVNLSREADKESHDRWSVARWDDLRRNRGRMISRAARTGCKRSWPLYFPQLPHERIEMNAVPNGVIAGLCGIQAAVIDGELDFHTLNPTEAERALRYAISEMNAFPPWCEDLVRAQPLVARRLFLECIGHEWAFTPDRQRVFEVMAKLLTHGATFGPIVADGVLERLRNGDPANPFILQVALKLLLAIPVRPLVALAEVAAMRVRTGPLDNSSTAVWLAFWLQLAAEGAIDWLEMTDSEDTRVRELTVRMCSCLSGRGADSFPRVESPSYLSSEHLARLVPLIFERVCPSEDVNRAGSGAYTPDARDDAQDFRAGLLRKLADDPSPTTPDILLRLAELPVLRVWRDWILHLRDENIEKQSRSVFWSPEQIREFARNHEVDPTTDEDLYRIALKRLDDLKMRVERAENSLREELHDNDESKLRRWFARRLEETARNRYHVPQEEELDQRRRPDIRFENPRTPPVPVELKWADSWSVNELYHALETQLFGDYLRDPRTRFGIFLLGFIGTKAHWEHPVDGRKLSFEDVVELQRIRAGELLLAHPSVREVSVVVLDFRAPTSA